MILWFYAQGRTSRIAQIFSDRGAMNPARATDSDWCDGQSHEQAQTLACRDQVHSAQNTHWVFPAVSETCDCKINTLFSWVFFTFSFNLKENLSICIADNRLCYTMLSANPALYQDTYNWESTHKDKASKQILIWLNNFTWSLQRNSLLSSVHTLEQGSAKPQL